MDLVDHGVRILAPASRAEPLSDGEPDRRGLQHPCESDGAADQGAVLVDPDGASVVGPGVLVHRARALGWETRRGAGSSGGRHVEIHGTGVAELEPPRANVIAI